MELKRKISTGLKSAMKEKDTTRLNTLRLVNAAIKDMEIAKRGSEEVAQGDISDTEILNILTKMIRQRDESVRAYEEAGRLELADQERAEREILAEFLPRPLNADERRAAIEAAISDAGAAGLRDMGKVMTLLKTRHAGRMDFASVGPEVRDRLAS